MGGVFGREIRFSVPPQNCCLSCVVAALIFSMRAGSSQSRFILQTPLGGFLPVLVYAAFRIARIPLFIAGTISLSIRSPTNNIFSSISPILSAATLKILLLGFLKSNWHEKSLTPKKSNIPNCSKCFSRELALMKVLETIPSLRPQDRSSLRVSMVCGSIQPTLLKGSYHSHA